MSDSVPLCLGLDGTLTPVRIADEQLLLAARHSPATLLWWLIGFTGRTRRSRRPASTKWQLDVDTLPLRRELLAWLRQERGSGRRLVLIADEDRATAEQVAAHLDLFDQVETTENFRGTRAERRRSALIARFGEHGFDY